MSDDNLEEAESKADATELHVSDCTTTTDSDDCKSGALEKVRALKHMLGVAVRACEEGASKLVGNDDKPLETKVKMGAVKHVLCVTMLGSDAKWLLFVTAARSSRYKDLLKPYPVEYIKSCFAKPLEVKIDSLLQIICETPPLPNMLDILLENRIDVNVVLVHLLNWLLVENHFPFLDPLNVEDFSELLRNEQIGPKIGKSCLPTRAFKVIYAPYSHDERNFDSYRKCFDMNFGFYGNQMDVFHALLSKGFKYFRHYKNKYLDEEVRLFSSLETSRIFSPPEKTWCHSLCGEMLSCVALCEYIDDPLFAHKDIQLGPDGRLNVEKICLPNTEAVRMRYLFFYEFIQKQGFFLPLED